jgi:hypothetical protein
MALEGFLASDGSSTCFGEFVGVVVSPFRMLGLFWRSGGKRALWLMLWRMFSQSGNSREQLTSISVLAFKSSLVLGSST